ncbi:MAG TPA: serpin family protein, partial [Verrucomicrobiae bacterium]|nr:serpin family protein [Verrucomicrobiae bacterium]
MIKLSKSSLLRAGTLCVILSTASAAFAQPAATDVVVTGNTRFAFDLYGRLKSTDGNLFFSPYSISTCLAMTWAGARGNTESQMAGVFHFSTVQTGLHSQFASLQKQLNAIQEKKEVALNIANGLWAQKDHPFLPAFLQIATRDYAANVQQVDFRTDAEAARNDINNWVSGKTADRIQNLIPSGALDAMTRLVLVNAIYFKGHWAAQFKASNTAPAPFTTASDQGTTAQFMNLTDNFRYAESDDLQLLELPYAGGDLSMVVLLPAETNSFKDFENTLSEEKLTGWLGQARKEKVNVFLPKFKLTQQFALADTLAAMGMTDAFSPSADFSGMDGARDLYISAVIHKAFVEVNEEGTEAAAATAVTVSAMAIARPMSEYVFRADHPFVFLIRDIHSG